VDLGYLSDPFARLFVQGPPTRRLPIINRGTYTRTTAIDKLVERFLATTASYPRRQIISLGAGTDTRCLRLFASTENRNITYHEIDFPEMITRKRTIIESTPSLRTVLKTPESISPTAWNVLCSSPDTGNRLILHGLDLRKLSDTLLPNLDPDSPTLLISECCLCYLQATDTTSVVGYFTKAIHAPISLVIYEPILPNDPFGRTMVSNLAARGITMPTLEVYSTPEQQEKRLRDAGFDEARSKTVNAIWNCWVEEEEKRRIDLLEGGLDEVEEWELLAGHYIVVWGWTTTRGQQDGIDLTVEDVKSGTAGQFFED
jgi:[phosphatase 2A protein]-leucine-carboxy methyltransferase